MAEEVEIEKGPIVGRRQVTFRASKRMIAEKFGFKVAEARGTPVEFTFLEETEELPVIDEEEEELRAELQRLREENARLRAQKEAPEQKDEQPWLPASQASDYYGVSKWTAREHFAKRRATDEEREKFGIPHLRYVVSPPKGWDPETKTVPKTRKRTKVRTKKPAQTNAAWEKLKPEDVEPEKYYPAALLAGAFSCSESWIYEVCESREARPADRRMFKTRVRKMYRTLGSSLDPSYEEPKEEPKKKRDIVTDDIDKHTKVEIVDGSEPRTLAGWCEHLEATPSYVRELAHSGQLVKLNGERLAAIREARGIKHGIFYVEAPNGAN